MATAPSSSSEHKISAQMEKKNKRKRLRGGGGVEEMISSEVSDNAAPQQSKRTKNPGVRVVGGRIYDSENGKTCHQCRQKTLDFTADCKNKAKGKPCTLKFCYTCLMNRYGEKAEDVASLEDWSCPRCRDICNCSFCMKKRGHKPTGMLVQLAKADGFSSVSDLIHVKGVENVDHYKNTKQISSPRKQAAPKEGTMISSPKKLGKENIFDGKIVSNVVPPSIPPPVEEKPKKKKIKDFKGYPKVDGAQEDEKDFKIGIHSKEESEKMDNFHNGIEVLGSMNVMKHPNVKDRSFNLQEKSLEIVVPLPTGTELVTISGIDIPKKDAGNVLQFLEFCAVFGKILDMRKGQGEVVIRELVKGRTTRRGKCSSIIQFQIQLLSVIQEDTGSESPTFDSTNGNATWLKGLKSCIPKSKNLLETFGYLDKAGEYDNLDMSKKLKLLNLLCDEVLGTEKIRNWIDDQNIKFAEEKKEAKEKLAAAKDKEKCLKKKMQDEIAEAVISRNGVPLTISEHEAVVSEIKKKVAQAHAEMLECKKIIPIDKERPDAVRTEPIFRNEKGHVYWRLKGYSEKSDILLQDIGNGEDSVELSENWFQFDEEQMTMIHNHISALREGRFRGRA